MKNPYNKQFAKTLAYAHKEDTHIRFSARAEFFLPAKTSKRGNFLHVLCGCPPCIQPPIPLMSVFVMRPGTGAGVEGIYTFVTH